MEAKKYKVIKKYESPYPNSIIFEKNEEVKIIKDSDDHPDWKDWIWCEGTKNSKAWTPIVPIKNGSRFIKDR